MTKNENVLFSEIQTPEMFLLFCAMALKLFYEFSLDISGIHLLKKLKHFTR